MKPAICLTSKQCAVFSVQTSYLFTGVDMVMGTVKEKVVTVTFTRAYEMISYESRHMLLLL